MHDERFYIGHGPLTVEALFPDCEIRGERARAVVSAGALGDAGANALAYADERRGGALESAAGAIVLTAAAAAAAPAGATLVITPRPRARFAEALRRLVSLRGFAPDAAMIAPDARIEAGVALAPGVVIGSGARIGADTQIGPNAVIGPGVTIGRRCRIGACATLYCALLGDDVTILAGAHIGEAGFAVAAGPEGLVDVMHIGRVILQDGVSLGAGVTVDRGLFADTVLSENAKIDNLSQIAHNVVVGRNVVMAAFAGISGSTRIEDGAQLGGRVGVADHVRIGKAARLAANTALFRDVPDGAVYGGFPGQPVRRWLREVTWLSKKASERRDAGE
ncbi:MAG: UDP-3-O-(3-hydroxymyristoyl)glucosamine N-acyltransferase [Hyphomonadaceae bacterium]